MKAVIMAGGQGTRLRPLTCNIPKPMMPILDKPVLEYAIELLKKNGITNIAVTLQYLSDEIISYFEDGKKFGVNLNYFMEENPLGTAGSVKNAEKFLDDTFIVISGDALTDIDISKAIAYHKKKKAIATLVLKEVPVPLEYGVVVTDKEGKVTGFLEKPSWSEVFSDKVNTGIYILEPEIFDYYEQNQKFDFSNDLFPILLSNNKPVYAYVADGYWCDIGNIEQYIKCHFDILKGIVKVKIKGERYGEGIWIGKNCQINPQAKITSPSYIGSNTKIYAGAKIGPYTILGKNNIVSSDATIKRSIAFDNCYIGDNAEVRGAVLCKNVQLESRSAVFEEAAIGDDTLIETKSIVKPGIKIWPNKLIGASSVVKSNVIWGGKFSKALFGKRGISGGINVDITPEFVSKLGSSYGSLLKSGAKVAISCSDDGAAQMFKYALATGLISMGIEVYDLKRMTTAMTRYAVMFFGVSGAIHVVVDRDDPQRVNILFMDKNGVDIDKNMERSIENSFIREDFRRVKNDALKKITHLSDTVEYYIRSLVNKLQVHNIKMQKYKIVLSTRNTLINSVMKNILSELKVNVKLYDEAKDLRGISRAVILNGANLGVYISDEGDSAVLVDEKGKIIKDDTYDALKAFIMLKSTELKTLVVPVTSSGSMEQIAYMCGAKFIRTKTSQNNILEAYIKNEKNLNKREVVNSYLNVHDAVGIVMLTLNLMANSNLALSKIISKFPKYYKRKQEIVCPWNMKGKVMRNLIEENSSESVELIEGVKLNYPDAWALVLPDAEEPVCRVYAESKNFDQVERLSNELARKIKDLVGVDIEV
ncbi:sugar phosphate nucleotidyltransferase [Clostridium ganghwense]|uniref:Sugar phosphate nucleotidyltransferase n=1 Tax=Clostridium ganghwense TaxID=312089 RepID=A0ABT4CS68_9CLOT|nr:sugar phosphate nucleotidyltransferase [Clostridium ganghwense]MCY6371892.1 sugar phosphate nucleotidyltransferase [Clostridium ganghwense]